MTFLCFSCFREFPTGKGKGNHCCECLRDYSREGVCSRDGTPLMRVQNLRRKYKGAKIEETYKDLALKREVVCSTCFSRHYI